MNGQEHLLRELKLDQRINTAVWAPDGKHLAVGEFFGDVVLLTDDGRTVWRGEEHEDQVYTLAFSPDGERLASSSDDERVVIWNARSGQVERTISPPGSDVLSVTWSPDGRRLACDAAPFIAQIWDALDGSLFATLEGHTKEVLCTAFSPDGRFLATASDDRTIRLWDAETGAPHAVLTGHRRRIEKICWSPDGRLLASGSNDCNVHLWEIDQGICLHVLQGHNKSVHALAFSPDGALVASGSPDRTVRLWSPETGSQIERIEIPAHVECTLDFSPDGARLAVAVFDRVLRIWDVARLVDSEGTSTTSRSSGHDDELGAWIRRQAATVGRRPRPGDAREPTLAPDLAWLPSAWAALHRIGIDISLGTVRDLLHWTAVTPKGVTPKVDTLHNCPEMIDDCPRMERLRRLHWPAAARIGLVALLLRSRREESVSDSPMQRETWKPPQTGEASQRTPSELRDALYTALGGEKIPAEQSTPSPLEIVGAAEIVDDRLLTLLEALGPRAVAADPGLPLQLLPRTDELPALSAPQRRLLGLHLDLGAGGAAQGRGRGTDHVGVEQRGDFRDLALWQFALPRDVFALRQARGELLFRARSGRELPRLRPAVLMLDVSPPTFGPVESITRLAAHTIASSLLDTGLPVALLTLGGKGSAHRMTERSDLIDLWTARSLEPADPHHALKTARRLREQLRDQAHESSLEPIVVLLTQAFFGEGEKNMAKIDGLRALFVDYPGIRLREPPLAAACERWTRIEAKAGGKLSGSLGALMQ